MAKGCVNSGHMATLVRFRPRQSDCSCLHSVGVDFLDLAVANEPRSTSMCQMSKDLGHLFRVHLGVVRYPDG